MGASNMKHQGEERDGDESKMFISDKFTSNLAQRPPKSVSQELREKCPLDERGFLDLSGVNIIELIESKGYRNLGHVLPGNDLKNALLNKENEGQ